MHLQSSSVDATRNLSEVGDACVQVFGIFFVIVIVIYAFKLSSFFGGGIQCRPFQLMALAFVLYAVISLMGLMELMDIV
jgi:uncharacterized membrane protein